MWTPVLNKSTFINTSSINYLLLATSAQYQRRLGNVRPMTSYWLWRCKSAETAILTTVQTKVADRSAGIEGSQKELVHTRLKRTFSCGKRHRSPKLQMTINAQHYQNCVTTARHNERVVVFGADLITFFSVAFKSYLFANNKQQQIYNKMKDRSYLIRWWLKQPISFRNLIGIHRKNKSNAHLEMFRCLVIERQDECCANASNWVHKSTVEEGSRAFV